MANVYFKKIDDFGDKEAINNFCYEILKTITQKENITFKGTVPLKVHFGEPGNNTFITPDNFAGIRKYLKENKISSCYMDSNVLYKGYRTETKAHIETAHKHGFTDLEVIIADGDENHPYNEITINKKYFEKCKISTRYFDYDSFIVLAHFKGHGLAGLGASIKQLAMGFAARGGKLHQHSNSVPNIDESICISCGSCVKKCPVNAISLPEKAKIDSEICVGCASCTTACPVNAITNNWDGTNFHEKLAEYAYAAALNKTNIYFNFAFNITGDCDCVGRQMDIINPNIGVLVSTDPVALDSATLDLFAKMNKAYDFSIAKKTFAHAAAIGLGEERYNLVLWEETDNQFTN